MSGSHRLCVRALGVVLAVVCLLAPVGFASAQDMGVSVAMQGLSFAPTTVHVMPGQTVTWTNNSPLQHTVTFDDGSFDSGLIDPDASLSTTFDTPGTYQYFCQPHGSAGLNGMAATLVVDDPNAAETTDATGPTTFWAAALQAALVGPDEYYPDH